MMERAIPSSRERPPTVRAGAPALNAAQRIDALSGDPNFMTSLARGLAVIRAFANERRPMSIVQLAAATGIPRAAVRRVLFTLRELNYVAAADRMYVLRPAMLALGHAYLSSLPLVAAAQPVLDRVSEKIEQSCSIATLDGDDILYLGRSVSSRIISVTLNVGSRLPAYCTSIGQVLLAHLPPAELEAYFARVDLHPYTDYTPATPKQLRDQLLLARRADYAIADQQMELGVRSIAVPVRNTAGAVVAGINVIVQAAAGTARQLKTLYLPHLQSAAHELGAQLVA